MKNSLLLLVFTLITQFAFSCCGGSQYQLYPLGESNNKLVVAELNVTRYCRSFHGGDIKGTHLKGSLNLSYWTPDSVSLIKKIGEFDFKISEREGRLDTPNLDSLYLAHILPLYKKCVASSKKLKGYIPAKPISYSFVNDSIYKNYQIKDDYILVVNGTKTSNYSFTRGYLNCIRDAREYQVGDKKVTVLHVNEKGSQFVKIDSKQSYIEENEKRFKNLFTALTYNKILWHGENRNYVFVD